MKPQHSNVLMFLGLIVCSISLKGQTTGIIFQQDAPTEKLFGEAVGQLLEGPTMSYDANIYFCDIYTSNNKSPIIWKYNLETGKAVVFRSPSGFAAGLMLDSQRRLVVCEANGQRVSRTDLKTGLSEIITNEFEGRPFNAPNDLAIDEQGNIYFTDGKISGNNPMSQRFHGVYRIDTKGSVELIITGFGKPNGIIISPDQKTLYISTSDLVITPSGFKGAKPNNNGKLLSFGILDDGSVSFKEELVNLGNMADGMTIDIDGNIYVALMFQKKIAVFSPSGEKIDEMSFPEDWLVSNASFGRGKYNSTLFVTAGKCLYSVKTNKIGYNLPFIKQ